MTLEQVREKIRASNMSYQEIADKAGITKTTVYMIVSGRNKKPLFQTVESLIKVLK